MDAVFSDDDLVMLEERLGDPMWRLTSGLIYKIKTADGQGVIPFVPRPEQVELLRELVASVESVRGRGAALMDDSMMVGAGEAVSVGAAPLVNGAGRGWQPRFVKLKARRLGFSTTVGVFVADCLGFRRSFRATLIDQTGDDASKKMVDIVRVAVNALREVWPLRLLKVNDSELTVDVVGAGAEGASSFYATTRARGGANDFLWCSELGVVQFDDPRRAEEIVTGAFPSARHGVIFVETTWKGGRGGKLYEVMRPTLEGVARDWRVSFSPWWMDPRNVDEGAAHDEVSLTYFAEIEDRLARDGVVLCDAQRRWWARERRDQGVFMFRENPTFLDECWRVPIEGAIYAAALDRARAEGRVCGMPVAGDCLVNTSWDLGSPRHTVVWYWQVVGREIRVIDCDMGFEGTLTGRVAMMLAKGYHLGTHYLPHDAMQTERSGGNFAAELRGAGLTNVVCVPRTASVWISINHVLEMMPCLVWRRCVAVERGLEALGAYRQQVESGGLARAEPVHDWASHPADALRTMGEAHRAGLFKFASAGGRPELGRAGGGGRKGMKGRRVSG